MKLFLEMIFSCRTSTCFCFSTRSLLHSNGLPCSLDYFICYQLLHTNQHEHQSPPPLASTYCLLFIVSSSSEKGRQNGWKNLIESDGGDPVGVYLVHVFGCFEFAGAQYWGSEMGNVGKQGRWLIVALHQHTRSALVGNKKVLGGERTRVLSKHLTEDRDVAGVLVLTL